MLQPTDDEKNIYSKIHEYYSRFIDEALLIGKKPIREGYVINCVAKYDKGRKKIIVDANYSFSLYKTTEGFQDVAVGFEEGEEESTFDKICIRDSKGKMLLEEENIELEDMDVNGARSRKTSLKIPEKDDSEKRVKVDLSVTEVGQDHWCLLTFNNLEPTNNFQLYLNCDEYVEIKKYSVFFVGAEYMVNISDTRKKIQISTNQWINQGTGLTVLMALPHTVAEADLP